MSKTGFENSTILVDGEVSGFEPVHGLVYRTATTTGISTTFIDMDFTGGQVELKNITHDTGSNPERVAVDKAGVYEVSYIINGIADTDPHTHFAHVIVNGSTEVIGSEVAQAASGAWAFQLSATFIVRLSANDYLTLQMKVDALTSQYNAGAQFSTAVCGSMYIKKIAD